MVINVGADGFAHGLWRWQTKSENDKIPLAVKNVLDQVILNKMAYQPTTQVMKGLVSLFDSNYLNDPLLEKVIPKNLIQFYKSNDGKWFENEITSESNLADMEKVYNNGIQSLSYINKNNGFLIFGSDTPSAPIYSNPPGLNGYYEIQNWIKAVKKICKHIGYKNFVSTGDTTFIIIRNTTYDTIRHCVKCVFPKGSFLWLEDND